MFLPVGDTPNPRNYTPWVNWAIITANVAVYLLISLPLTAKGIHPRNPLLQEYLQYLAPLARSWGELRQMLSQLTAYDLFVFAHGYKPGAPELGDLFFSLFLHGGFWHLFGNMLFLWIYGDNAEHRLGRLGYLLTYLVSGAAATLFFGLFAGRSMMPLVGASGAISGVLGVYFLLFPRNQVKVFVMLFPFFMNFILLPARWVLGVYLVIDNLLPFLAGSQSNVAHGAHIGGFLAGLGIAWVGEHFAWKWPWTDHYKDLGRRPHVKDTVIEAEVLAPPLYDLREAIAQQNPHQALQTLQHLGREDLAELSPTECAVLADWLDQAGYSIAATRLLRGCLGQRANASNLADAYLALGLLRLKQGQPTAAYQHLLNVFDYNPSPETAERARQALAQIDVYRRK